MNDVFHAKIMGWSKIMTIEPEIVNQIKQYFENESFIVYERRRIVDNIEIDLLAIKNECIIGIEVKAGITNVQLNKAFIQASQFKAYVDYSYIGLPFPPNEKFLIMCKSVGIGIIITNNKTQIILNATKNNEKIFTTINIKKKDLKRTNDYCKHEILLLPILMTIKKHQNQAISSGHVASIIGTSQQTASRLLLFAVKEKLIERISLINGQHFRYYLTDKGNNFLIDIAKDIMLNNQKQII